MQLSLQMVEYNYSILLCDYSNYVVVFLCSVDDKFPKITFHFENDLTLDVYPYDYLLEYEVMTFHPYALPKLV